MNDLNICFAFDGMQEARRFGKWLANLPISRENQFYVEPINTDYEWDSFFSEPWQLDTITLPKDDFAIEVDAYFSCDPAILSLMEDCAKSISLQYDLERMIADHHKEIRTITDLIDSAKKLGATELAKPHSERLAVLLAENAAFEKSKDALIEKRAKDGAQADHLVDLLIQELVSPLNFGDDSFSVTSVYARTPGLSWREVQIPRKNP